MEIKIGYKLSIGNQAFYRITEGHNYIKHYTTKILQIEDKKIRALDGFSETDRNYIDYLLRKHDLDAKIFFRRPKSGNSIFVIKHKSDILITKMSADIVFFGNDDDTIKFYLKPISETLNMRYSDLLKDLMVIDENGNITDINNYKPNYFPYLRELQYDKPDLTIQIYDGDTHILHVYKPYYFYVFKVKHPFYGDMEQLVFLGYLSDLCKLGIIPDLDIKTIHVDNWRTRTESDIKNDNVNNNWIKLSDYEWCGSYSESEEKLYDIYEDCKLMTDFNFFEYVIAIIHYTSNIFVTYLDLYVKPNVTNVDKMMRNVKMLKERVKETQYTQISEILKNVFPSIFS